MGNEAEPWAGVLDQLKRRDEIEQRDSGFVKAFEQFSYLKAAAGLPDSDRLIKENSHLHEETESLMTRLNSQTMKLDGANSRIKELTHALAEKELKIKRMNSKLANISDELAEKNRLFDILNDEQLIAQIQQNVMRDRIAELEKKCSEA